MDATEKLILQSTASAVVLGSGDNFLMIPLHGALPQASLELANARGYSYAGVVCVVNGHVEIDGPERELLMLAAVPFAEYVVAQTAAKDDSAEWLARLWSLEDTR